MLYAVIMPAQEHRSPDPRRVNRPLLTAWALLLFLLLLLGLFMPLHTDEINWSIPNHRAIADKLHVTTLLPQCQAADNFAKPLPLSWYPYALANDLIFMHVGGPLWIRLVGMARFTLFLIAAWFITTPLSARLKCSPTAAYTLFLSLLCLTPLPLLMQVDRPEQSLFLAMAIFLALALNTPDIATRRRLRWTAAALLVLTTLLSFPVHPKAVALLPVAIASSYIVARNITKPAWVAWLAVLATVAFALRCAAFWLHRYDCTYSEQIRQLVTDNALPFGQLWTHPMTFVAIVSKTLLVSVMYDFALYNHLKYGWQWLPYTLTPLSDALTELDAILAIVAFYIYFIVFSFCVVMLARTLAGKVRQLASHSPDAGESISDGMQDSALAIARALACASIVSLVGFMLIVGPRRPFYAFSLEGPLLVLSGLLGLSSISGNVYQRPFWRHTSSLLQVIAVLNILMCSFKYFPYVTEAATREKTDHGLAALLSPWMYERQKNAIEAAYHECHLPLPDTARHLIVDSYTYPVLRHSFEPFSYDYVTNTFAGQRNIPLLLNVMKRYDSDGIIVNCRQVPHSLAPLLTQHGAYCCALGKHSP